MAVRVHGVQAPGESRSRMPLRRVAPTLVAAALALAYVIISPPSLDLAAHLFRAKLFDAEGFGLWSNWWYDGHHVPGYSVLFPALAATFTPQVVGAAAAVATATLFELLAFRQFGERAWLGTLWFGAATATDLYTGRLTFAFGLLPAVATALALQRRRPTAAILAAILTALASPVAALFAAVAGAAFAVIALTTRRRRDLVLGLAVASAALLPVLLISIAFPEGGTEPFTFATLWPIVAILAVLLVALPRELVTLRAGAGLYLVGCLISYAVPSPVGSNVVRLGSLMAGPVVALVWWRRRVVLVALLALPLLYIQWQAPIRDVHNASGDPSASPGYWQPLLGFLNRQRGRGPTFRVEIPFTGFHMEAYEVAPHFPLARGWERQLDIKVNPIFYGDLLNGTTYEQWLHRMAVRYVALPDDSRLDYSATRETMLIRRGLPYLRLVARLRHWRVYAVADPTPIVSGSATLQALGPDSLTLSVSHPGPALLRVHFTPYWELQGVAGCVAPAGNDFTALTFRTAGPARLVIAFSPWRIHARSPRCTGSGHGDH